MALFYAYEFYLRISPEVMQSALMQTFGIHAALFGLFASVYYYAYQVMQIPAGILMDRYGLRRVLALAAFVVAVGCSLFAFTHWFPMALLARILMGIGSAFAFIGCLKLAGIWFPKKHFALVVGLTNMLGVLGAISGEGPLAAMVEHMGWRQSMWFSAGIGLLLMVLMFFIVRDKKTDPQKKLAGSTFWQALLKIICCEQTWMVAIFAGLMVAPIIGFAELWSVSFLQVDYHVSHTVSATLTSTIFIGIAVGGPFNGWLSGFIGRRKPVMWMGVVGALLANSIVIYVHLPHQYLLIIALFFIGFFASTMLLCFAVNTEINSPKVNGSVIALTNMVVVILGVFPQPMTGLLLDWVWDGKGMPGGGSIRILQVFHLWNYEFALALLPIFLIIAMVLLKFIKETHCKQVVA